MELVQAILDKNPYYTQGKKIRPRGIVLRSAGCAQPSAKVFINNWNRATYDRTCVHAFIDVNDGVVYQTLPWDYKGHYASESVDSAYIGINICEPAQIKYSGGSAFTVSDANYNTAYRGVKRTYDSAVELFAMLCTEFGFDPMKDIYSYMDCVPNTTAPQLDPEHLWFGLKMRYNMNMFREDVKKEMGKSHNRSETASPRSVKEKKVEVTKPSKVYKVKVDVANLNIRTGPASSYDPIGRYAPVGVSMITEIVEGSGSTKGWGKLKSGEGWISLDYATLLD